MYILDSASLRRRLRGLERSVFLCEKAESAASRSNASVTVTPPSCPQQPTAKALKTAEQLAWDCCGSITIRSRRCQGAAFSNSSWTLMTSFRPFEENFHVLNTRGSCPEKAMYCQGRTLYDIGLILLRAYTLFYFMAETAKPKGAYDPRLYSSTQPYPVPVQVIHPYNATANRRPTYLRFLYAFALAALVWFVGSIFLRSAVHFVPWVSSIATRSFICVDDIISEDVIPFLHMSPLRTVFPTVTGQVCQ